MHYVHAVPASVSQKKISDPLELEFHPGSCGHSFVLLFETKSCYIPRSEHSTKEQRETLDRCVIYTEQGTELRASSM